MNVFLSSYDQIKQCYNDLVSNFTEAYHHLSTFDFFKIEKKDVLTSIDGYIEAMILKSILLLGQINKEEYKAVKDLVKHKDFFELYDITNKDYYQLIEEQVDYLLNSFPEFIKMTIIIDVELEPFYNNKTRTFAEYVYSCFKLIVKCCNNEANDDMVDRIVSSSINQFKAHKIVYYQK